MRMDRWCGGFKVVDIFVLMSSLPIFLSMVGWQLQNNKKTPNPQTSHLLQDVPPTGASLLLSLELEPLSLLNGCASECNY